MAKQKVKKVADNAIIELIGKVLAAEKSEDMVNIAKTIPYIADGTKGERTEKLSPNVWVPVAITGGASILSVGLYCYLSETRIVDLKIVSAIRGLLRR